MIQYTAVKNITGLKALFEKIVKREKIKVSMLVALGGVEIAMGKKIKKKVDAPKERVYVEIHSHMTVGKFEMTLKAALDPPPDVLDAQIVYGLKQAKAGEHYIAS